jgi:hypothetical protein
MTQLKEGEFLETRAHIHQMIPAEPGIVAVFSGFATLDDVEGRESWEVDVPAWGVYDVIDAVHGRNGQVIRELSRRRSAGPLLFAPPEHAEVLVPLEIVSGAHRRLERNGYPLGERLHRNVRKVSSGIPYVNNARSPIDDDFCRTDRLPLDNSAVLTTIPPHAPEPNWFVRKEHPVHLAVKALRAHLPGLEAQDGGVKQREDPGDEEIWRVNLHFEGRRAELCYWPADPEAKPFGVRGPASAQSAGAPAVLRFPDVGSAVEHAVSILRGAAEAPEGNGDSTPPHRELSARVLEVMRLVSASCPDVRVAPFAGGVTFARGKRLIYENKPREVFVALSDDAVLVCNPTNGAFTPCADEPSAARKLLELLGASPKP